MPNLKQTLGLTCKWDGILVFMDKSHCKSVKDTGQTLHL